MVFVAEAKARSRRRRNRRHAALKNSTGAAFSTSRSAAVIAEVGSVLAAGLGTSLAPITKATSAVGELGGDVLQRRPHSRGRWPRPASHGHVARHPAATGGWRTSPPALFLQMVDHLAEAACGPGPRPCGAGDVNHLDASHDEGASSADPGSPAVSTWPPPAAALSSAPEAAQVTEMKLLVIALHMI